MAVDFMGYRSSENATSKLEECAVQEAASGLESVEKLIRLLSDRHVEIETMDCKAVADVAVSKFKRVISLLGRTRTGHARFRRAPLAQPQPQADKPIDTSSVSQSASTRVFYATPIQQIPPPPPPVPPPPPPPTKESSSTTINFSSYSSAGPAATTATTSFVSSLTGDTESKNQQQPSSSSPAFQISNLLSAGKPPLSSTTTTSLKRKCSSENLGSGKCASGSSGRCHCSKKRYLFIISLFYQFFPF